MGLGLQAQTTNDGKGDHQDSNSETVKVTKYKGGFGISTEARNQSATKEVVVLNTATDKKEQDEITKKDGLVIRKSYRKVGYKVAHAREIEQTAQPLTVLE